MIVVTNFIETYCRLTVISLEILVTENRNI